MSNWLKRPSDYDVAQLIVAGFMFIGASLLISTLVLHALEQSSVSSDLRSSADLQTDSYHGTGLGWNTNSIPYQEGSEAPHQP